MTLTDHPTGDLAAVRAALDPTTTAGESQAEARLTRVRGGLAAVFGKWPGDETDAEIEAALKAMG